MGDGADREKILDQPGAGAPGAGLLRHRLTRPEEELGIGHDPLPRRWPRVPPRRVDPPDLPARQMVGRDRPGQALALSLVGARQRDEVLGGGVGHDPSLADEVLDRSGKLPEERQATADPAHRPVEAFREYLEGQAEPAPEFVEKPRLLERGLPAGAHERPPQEDRLQLRDVPPERQDHVPPETSECPHATVAVDHHRQPVLLVTVHHDDRNDLSHLGQGRDKAPVPLRRTDSERLVAEVELVDLNLHPYSPVGSDSTW